MSLLEWQWTLTDWVLVLSVVVLYLYHCGTRSFSRITKHNIPHSKPLPFLGNMAGDILKKRAFPDTILHRYNKTKQHQYSGFFMFQSPMFMINDPELIKTITVKDFDFFTDHKQFIKDDSVWNNALFNLKGTRWREMRSKLSPAFTSSKMKTMFVLVSECCKQLVNFLQESEPGCNISKEGDMLVLELKEFFTRYTNDVIATTAFGVSVDSLKQPNNEFFMMGQRATNFGIWKSFSFLMLPDLMALLGKTLISKEVTRFFTSLVLDTMKTRETQGIVRHDMLQLLMEAKKDEGDKKIKMDDMDIVAQAVVFFIAGFDSSSTLLCFVCYMLATHPEVQQRLHEEVDANEGTFTYEAINNMKYLDMVISETLRMYPPSPASERLCIRKYTLKADPPVEFHPGDSLLIPTFGLHKDPKYFPEPEKFDPERFSEENKGNINPFTYLPFGVGPRSCIGNRFALMETKLALVHILSKFNIKPVSKTPKTITLTQKGFNIAAEGGFWMGLKPRNT